MAAACGGGTGNPGKMAIADTAALEAMCCGPGNPVCDDQSSPADGDCADTGDNIYLNAIPCDPVNAGTDIYIYEGTTATYCISALMSDSTYFTCSNGSCFNNAAANCAEL